MSKMSNMSKIEQLRGWVGSSPFSDTEANSHGLTDEELQKAVEDGILSSAYPSRSSAPETVKRQAKKLAFVFKGEVHA